ncbi:hypothetical protein HDU80_011312, partial [Chytriomyces hyalinus]
VGKGFQFNYIQLSTENVSMFGKSDITISSGYRGNVMSILATATEPFRFTLKTILSTLFNITLKAYEMVNTALDQVSLSFADIPFSAIVIDKGQTKSFLIQTISYISVNDLMPVIGNFVKEFGFDMFVKDLSIANTAAVNTMNTTWLVSRDAVDRLAIQKQITNIMGRNDQVSAADTNILCLAISIQVVPMGSLLSCTAVVAGTLIISDTLQLNVDLGELQLGNFQLSLCSVVVRGQAAGVQASCIICNTGKKPWASIHGSLFMDAAKLDAKFALQTLGGVPIRAAFLIFAGLQIGNDPDTSIIIEGALKSDMMGNFSMIYFFADNISLLDMIVGHAEIKQSELLEWIKSFLPALTTLGFFAKVLPEEIQKESIPSYSIKLARDNNEVHNKVLKYITMPDLDQKCILSTGFIGKAFHAQMTFLGMSAEFSAFFKSSLSDVSLVLDLQASIGPFVTDALHIHGVGSPEQRLLAKFNLDTAKGNLEFAYIHLDFLQFEMGCKDLFFRILKLVSSGLWIVAKKKHMDAIDKLSGMLMIPRGIKLDLSLGMEGDKEDLVGALLTNLQKAFTGAFKMVEECLDNAIKELEKHENVPIVGIFVKIASLVVKTVRKGLNWLGDLVKNLIQSVLQIREICLGGEIDAKGGTMVYVYFDMTLFGGVIKGGVVLKSENLLAQLAKFITGLFLAECNKAEVEKSGMRHYEKQEEDTDEDDESARNFKRESPKFNCNYPEGTFTKLSNEEQAKLDKPADKLDEKIEILSKKLRDKQNAVGQVTDVAPKQSSEILNILTGCSISPKPPALKCPLCEKDVIASWLVSHLRQWNDLAQVSQMELASLKSKNVGLQQVAYKKLAKLSMLISDLKAKTVNYPYCSATNLDPDAIDLHLTVTCPCYQINCHKFQWLLKDDGITFSEECEDQCEKRVLLKDYKKHIMNDCPAARCACMECDLEIPVKERMNHLIHDCPSSSKWDICWFCPAHAEPGNQLRHPRKVEEFTNNEYLEYMLRDCKHTVKWLRIKNGFSGLVRSEVAPISWQQVINWQSLSGSELGTNRDHPTPVAGTNILDISDAYATGFIDCGLIAYALQKHNIQALLIIGGFEAFTSVVTPYCHLNGIFKNGLDAHLIKCKEFKVKCMYCQHQVALCNAAMEQNVVPLNVIGRVYVILSALSSSMQQ